MHEVGIAINVLDIIETNARGHGEGTVRSLKLRVGELSGIKPEALQFALEVCSKGTRAEGMEVDIVQVPAVLRCTACGEERPFVLGETVCAACGSEEVRVEGGSDLQVESFEME